MSIKNDRWIIEQAKLGMIDPFESSQMREGVVSYGVSSFGYDMRVSPEFKIFTNVMNSVIDPKSFDPKCFVEVETDVCIVPANSFALARSVEYFRIPRNVVTITVGKSTYARCGIITNVTPFEPEWEGHVTLEISNTTPLPAKIYANEGALLRGRVADHELQGQEGQVPGAAGSDAAEDLGRRRRCVRASMNIMLQDHAAFVALATNCSPPNTCMPRPSHVCPGGDGAGEPTLPRS
jgi:dCTP deaminase